MNPSIAFAARTARLAREAATPVYSTSTPTAEEARIALLCKAEEIACGDDFCSICGRCTDHFGEHSDEQILAWTKTRMGRILMA